MQATGQELPGLRVVVDKVVHHRDANFPPETPHAFVYFLTISNVSQETVRLLGRKWILRATDGSVEVIEGDGIVGETPTLAPGETFSYNSYHLTGAALTAEGASASLAVYVEGDDGGWSDVSTSGALSLTSSAPADVAVARSGASGAWTASPITTAPGPAPRWSPARKPGSWRKSPGRWPGAESSPASTCTTTRA